MRVRVLDRWPVGRLSALCSLSLHEEAARLLSWLLCFPGKVWLSLSRSDRNALQSQRCVSSCPGKTGARDQVTMFQGLTLDFKAFYQGWDRSGAGDTALPGQLCEARIRGRVSRMPLYLLT